MAFRPVPALLPRLLRTSALSAAMLFVWAWAAPFGAQAQDLLLDLPLDCADTGLSQGCVIQNFYDQDPGPECRDYACGRLCYDGHEGTDFRVTKAAMDRGVMVRALAGGVVKGLRDGMPDVHYPDLPPGTIDQREAGNLVLLDHGDGWTTQYVHMKEGSVLVHKGQKVSRGQPLGMVGLSGCSDFPHLEIQVRYQGKPVDPFTGPLAGQHQGCGTEAGRLWTERAMDQLRYVGAGVVEHGFTDHLPDLKSLYDWEPPHPALAVDAPVLLYWTVLFGIRTGDQLSLVILGPDGGVFAEHHQTVEKTQAQHTYYLGRELNQGTWPPGAYRARCLLERGEPGHQRLLVDETALVTLR